MVQVSYPGVYVEEVPSGVKPIEGVSTSTAAFIGVAEKGPLDEAKKVSSWTEFQSNYGSYVDGSYLPNSVFQFFNNGGRQCYVVRVAQDPKTASITIRNRAPDTAPEGLVVSAKSPGKWGNYLHLVIEDGTDDPDNTFKIEVRESEKVSEVPDITQVAPLEVHDNLSMNPQDPNFVEKVLSSQSNLISARVHANNTTLAAGIHRSGPTPTVPLPSGNRKLQININGDGYQEITLADPCDTLANVATSIQNAVRALSQLKASTAPASFSNFTCTVADGRLVLTSGAPGATSAVKILNATSENAATFLKLGLSNGGSEQHGAAVQRPANGTTYQVGDDTKVGAVADVEAGSDGTTPVEDQTYINGLQLLNNKDDVNLVCVPGVGSTAVVDAGLNYCRNRTLQDCFFIGDMDSTDDTPDEAKAFRNSLTTPNSYGAVYFPWLKVLDPTGKSKEPILLPPSGFVAGMYAQIDSKRGVWKAPAGTEAVIGGAVGLAVNLTDTQQGNLNKKAINCLRQFPASGIVIWGSRALSSDPEWRYIPVRRMAIFLRVSIYYGIQWAVFEPNDEELWASLRLNIGSFMMRLFRQGAFQGDTPSKAFFVKCDSETTTQADIDAGIVNVLVGFAPLKPAEFVIVKISQKAGQGAT